MKFTKTTASAIAAAVVLTSTATAGLSAISSVAEAAGVTWKFDSTTGTLTISGSGAMDDPGAAYKIPWNNNRSSIKKVVIAEGVTSIASFAFDDCYKLASVEIPSTVKTIGGYAFKGCYNLKGVTLPNGLTSIGEFAFNGSAVSSVNIPDSVTTIGGSAFKGCPLSSVNIPKNLTSIEDHVFYGTSLTSISIPSNVKSIGDHAFDSCGGLKNVTIANGLETLGNCAFNFCTAIESIELPASLKTIGEDAFNFCEKLAVVNIPANVTTIGGGAFNKCSITSITIPSKVTKIGSYAFNGCSQLAEVTFEPTTPPNMKGMFTITAFDDTPVQNGEGIVKVPASAVDAYKNTFKGIFKSLDNIKSDGVAHTHTLSYTADGNKITQTCSGGDLTATAVLTLDSNADLTYKGQAITPVKVTYSSNWNGSKPEIVYTDNNKVGTAKASLTVGGKTAELTFEINDGSAEKVAAAKAVIESACNAIVATNNTTQADVEKVIADAPIGADVTATVKNFVPQPAVVGAMGRIFFEVEISSGTTTDTLSVTRTIAALEEPKNDQERIDNAKAIIANLKYNLLVTNDTTEADVKKAIEDALKNTGVTVTVSNFSKTEATQTAAGSVSCDVALECGAVSDATVFEVDIKKLPNPQDTLDAAMVIVNTTLKGLSADNDTTADTIKKAVETALSSIDGVTVTVEDFSKTEATEDAEGNVKATVKVAYEGLEDSAELNVTIAKLGTEPVNSSDPGNSDSGDNNGDSTTNGDSDSTTNGDSNSAANGDSNSTANGNSNSAANGDSDSSGNAGSNSNVNGGDNSNTGIALAMAPVVLAAAAVTVVVAKKKK